MKRHLFALLLAFPLVATAAVEVYPAAFFAEARPSNAADMLARLPGFTLVEADEDVRGYAGAQGNVLIDGARPTSKRDAIDDVLERIPAPAVERIELIRAGTPGYEFFGQAMLANIVRRREARTEAAIEVGALADARGGVRPQVEAEWSRQWNGRGLELAFGRVPELDEDSGRGTQLELEPDGTVDARSRRDTRRDLRLDQASADWRQPFAHGKLQASAALRDSDDRSATRITGDEAETLDESERLREAEAGLRYARTLDGGAALEALASHRAGWLDLRERERDEDDEEDFMQDTRSRESIARVDLRHARTRRLTINGSAEIALNALVGEARLVENGESVSLPGSRVDIGEERADVSTGVAFAASDAWQLEAALAVEHSRLQQSGDTRLARAFTYLKPSATTRWDRKDREAWRLSLGRSVGQLEFEDFVASAALDTDLVTAGNAQLEPEKTWRLALGWERGFGRDGAVAITLAHERIDDVVDLVPVVAGDEVFDAPGNIARGTRHSVSVDAGTSLDAFGWANARIDVAVLWQRSRVRDPVTGIARGISGEPPLEGKVAFIHSPGRLKWGIEIGLAERETEYRLDEVSVERVAASTEVFVERQLGDRWRLRAELSDVAGRSIRESRIQHDGSRLSAPIERYEQRDHRVPGQLLLTLRREMGG